MVQVVCTQCGRGGAGPTPPYNCVGVGGCGGQKTMIPPAKPPRPPRVTDLRIELVHYHAAEGACNGSNLLYKVDGRPSSSRVPWVAQNPAAEAARLEKLLERTASLRARRQPKANLSTLEESEK